MKQKLIYARRGDKVRSFSKKTWDSMNPNKYGWTECEAPPEALLGNARPFDGNTASGIPPSDNEGDAITSKNFKAQEVEVALQAARDAKDLDAFLAGDTRKFAQDIRKKIEAERSLEPNT